jgi:hypothetical protein
MGESSTRHVKRPHDIYFELFLEKARSSRCCNELAYDNHVSNLPSFLEHSKVSSTSVVNKYIDLTPDLGSLVQFAFDDFEPSRHVKLKNIQIW